MTADGTEFHIPPGDEPGVNDIKFGWSGIDPYISSGNTFENNKILKIGGKLKEALASKHKRAEDEKIFEEKGWFACEIEEGVVDEECREREEAKGNQGMPRDLFVFEPLMANFDEFVVEEKDLEKNSKEKTSYDDLDNKERNLNDFEEIDENKKIIQEDNNFDETIECEVCDYTMEKVYAGLFFLTLAFLIASVIYFKKKR